MISSYITIGGSGSRLKSISPVDKHLLFYNDKRIIDHIKNIIPDAKTIGDIKTNNRKETLAQIKEKENILIIDCDIIPIGFSYDQIDTSTDCIFVFRSAKRKYSSIIIENNKVLYASEDKCLSNIKCSGIYFIKNLETLLLSMTDSNSIISGMIGSYVIYEDSFLRLGDIEDYSETIGISC